MRCPSCLKVITDPVEACPHCEFSLAKLDILFGTVPRHIGLVSDHSTVFDAREQQHLEQILARMRRHFPGLNVSIVAMEIRASFKPREYVFWLVNRGRFAPIDQRLERSLFVVLFFDTLSRSVFLTTGYGLQGALPEEMLQAVLESGLPELRKGNFYRASLAVLRHLRRSLKAYSKGPSWKDRATAAVAESTTVNEWQSAS